MMLLSAGDALRVIAAGGIYVNGCRVIETQQLMSPDKHILQNNLTLLRIGASVFGVGMSNNQ